MVSNIKQMADVLEAFEEQRKTMAVAALVTGHDLLLLRTRVPAQLPDACRPLFEGLNIIPVPGLDASQLLYPDGRTEPLFPQGV